MTAGGRSGAVVVGSDYKCLGVVRSLGRHHIPVCVLRDEHAVAAWSRYATRILPWPEGTEADRIAYLLALARTHGLHLVSNLRTESTTEPNRSAGIAWSNLAFVKAAAP